MPVTLPSIGSTGWGTTVNAAFDEILNSGRTALEYPFDATAIDFTIKKVGAGTTIWNYDFVITEVEDAYSVDGSDNMTTANFTNPQFGLGKDRNSTLHKQAKDSATVAEYLGGGFWDVNKDSLGTNLRFGTTTVQTWNLRAINPLTQAQIADIDGAYLIGLDSQRNINQNVMQVTAYGYGDTTLELNANGKMMQALLVLSDTFNHDGGTKAPDRTMLIKCLQAGGGTNNAIGLEMWHYGLPRGNGLIQVSSQPSNSLLMQLEGPKNLPGGTGTANAAFADLFVAGYFKSYGLALVDGIGTPASTPSGYALIFVDSADGDLKIRFNDGTVKTIVVDT